MYILLTVSRPYHQTLVIYQVVSTVLSDWPRENQQKLRRYVSKRRFSGDHAVHKMFRETQNATGKRRRFDISRSQ